MFSYITVTGLHVAVCSGLLVIIKGDEIKLQPARDRRQMWDTCKFNTRF